MKSEDGMGSRRPLLGDAGMSPHQFHFPISKAPQNGHENPFCGVFYVGGRDEKALLTRENGIM